MAPKRSRKPRVREERTEFDPSALLSGPVVYKKDTPPFKQWIGVQIPAGSLRSHWCTRLARLVLSQGNPVRSWNGTPRPR